MKFLTPNEEKIIKLLANYDSLSALEIARYGSIHRTNTYDSLRSLQKKGFVIEMNSPRTKFMITDRKGLDKCYERITKEFFNFIESLKNASKLDKKTKDDRLDKVLAIIKEKNPMTYKLCMKELK